MALRSMTGGMALRSMTEERVLDTTTEETTRSLTTEETLRTKKWIAQTPSNTKRAGRMFASSDSQLMETRRSSGEAAFEKHRERTETSTPSSNPSASPLSSLETRELTHFSPACGWELSNCERSRACLDAKGIQPLLKRWAFDAFTPSSIRCRIKFTML